MNDLLVVRQSSEPFSVVSDDEQQQYTAMLVHQQEEGSYHHNRNNNDQQDKIVQLFTAPINHTDTTLVSTDTNNTNTRMIVRPRWSLSSSSSSSCVIDLESSDGDEDDITMVWNKGVGVGVAGDNIGDENYLAPILNINTQIINVEDNENKIIIKKEEDETYSNIEKRKEEQIPIITTQKLSLKEQLKLKLPSSILHHSNVTNNSSAISTTTTTDNTSSSKATTPTNTTTTESKPSDFLQQAIEHSIIESNSGEMLLDDTSRRFTFNSTDIIKAVFEGKHDEQVEKLLRTDVSDYLTQLVKSRKNETIVPVNNSSAMKRMNSAFLTSSSPIGISKNDSSSNMSSPCSSPNLEKLNTIIEKKKLTRSNTTVQNYTHPTDMKQRRKITAIGSGMIPNDFNQVHSPMSDSGAIGFSQSDGKLTSSKRSMSIGANIQSYYSNSSPSLQSNSPKSGSDSVSTDDIYRVTFLGSVGVGKTSVINKFIKGSFSNEYNSTVFEDIYHKPLMFLKYQEIKLLEILDTSALHIKHYKNKANQEDESPSMEMPSSFLSDYIINCDAYILVYSVDDIQSYKYCKDIYKSIVGQKKLAGLKRTKSNLRASGNSLVATPRTVARSDIPLVLVGNKSDVGVEEKFIDPQKVWEDVHTELAFGSNCSFVETSAKNEDVDCVFEALVNRICLREEPKSSSKIQISSSLSTKSKHDPNKKCVIL